MIVAARVEAFTAPSKAASVVSELGHGAPVCVLDETNYAGVLLHRPGWLAIRLPSGIGYVPVEAVDLPAPAPEVSDCGASAHEHEAQDPEPSPRSRAAPMAFVPRPSAVEPAAAAAAAPARPALIAGGFVPLRPVRFLLGLGTGMAWLSKQTAAAHRIGESGISFNGTLALTIYDVFMVSGSFAAAFPSDHASFSQDVVLEMGGGDAHSAGSSLEVASYSIAAGLRTPFWALGPTESGWVAAAAFAQYGSAGIGGNRRISDCVDCRHDDLNMPGGTFWQVGVDLLVPSSKPVASYGVAVSYLRYEAGAGFVDEVRVGLSCWLQ